MKTYIIHVNGQRFEVTVEEKKEGPAVRKEAAPVTAIPMPSEPPAAVQGPPSSSKAAAGNGNIVTAPLPGKVVSVKVKAGAPVRKGQVLMVLEAMKMENEIVAAADGKVAEIYVGEGSSVNVGQPLLKVE
ncbi:MAG: biotin/lipoyl-binding protein [Moorella humiferrea]|uniref:Glutaconyl-CoA decarboxylase subunit gamma n=1 Tax=Neomoorella humiferrea TaxID=676965 RepID=A0A2T0ASR7_9FIRM|nr:biotin/lipoyl-containing protein [Moorella humiferrea]MBE3572003.1 biotin/lipoyl-binding protein [Moorella humiferrea]PRR73145.1 Glutaconyl-CoA decarboxylase subunit gamma [Moorella humiferrea]